MIVLVLGEDLGFELEVGVVLKEEGDEFEIFIGLGWEASGWSRN